MSRATPGDGATTADYNSGKAVIGTLDPYRLVRYTPDQIDLLRYKSWGTTSDWEHVSIRVLPSAHARIAAILSGDVDLIEAVPPADQAQLKANDRISWSTARLCL